MGSSQTLLQIIVQNVFEFNVLLTWNNNCDPYLKIATIFTYGNSLTPPSNTQNYYKMSSFFYSSVMKFCRMFLLSFCKSKTQNWEKYELKIRINELLYLTYKFRVKSRHFQKLVDTIIKYCSDKHWGKKVLLSRGWHWW